MTTVAPAPNTYAQIEKLVRRFTASSSESSLKSIDIQEQVNTFYSADFPYSIKLDVLRSVYTFYTQPNIDRYPLDVNYNQGVRAPVYVEGIQGTFFKDRNEFYAMWPRWPTKFQQAVGSITGAFTFTIPGPFLSKEVVIGATDSLGNAISIADDGNGNLQLQVPNPVVYQPSTVIKVPINLVGITEPNPDGSATYFNDLLSSYRATQPNAQIIPGTVSFYLDFGLGNQTLYQDTNSDGVIYDISGPFTISSGSINYTSGFLTLNFTSIPGSGVPAQADLSYYPNLNATVVPGMYNLNTQNPGLIQVTNIGTVDYVTGVFVIDFTLGGITAVLGQEMTIWVSQYQTGRPYCLLFWNNEFTIRPVPKLIHKVEVETYLTPVQFMQSTDSPILNQFVQYIAYGAAMEILRQRQDFDGVANLMEGFKRQESMVLERQGVEEINSRNATIFASSQGNGNGFNNAYGWGWY